MSKCLNRSFHQSIRLSINISIFQSMLQTVYLHHFEHFFLHCKFYRCDEYKLPKVKLTPRDSSPSPDAASTIKSPETKVAPETEKAHNAKANFFTPEMVSNTNEHTPLTKHAHKTRPRTVAHTLLFPNFACLQYN